MLIDFNILVNKYQMKINKVFHVGGHYGQEHQAYLDIGVSDIVYFEPQKNVYEILQKNVNPFRCINKALGASITTMQMYCEDANQGMSSSLLKPSEHLKQYPHIIFDKVEDVVVSTLDYEVEFNEFDGFNFINMDVQGYELEVLKGSKKTLENVEYIYTEVNRANVYDGCVQIEELDSFLRGFGFGRKETNWEGVTWGDALYIKC